MSDGAGTPLPADLGAALDALRERGVDPVRLRFVESLARRATAFEGAARRVLDERLARLVSAFGEELDPARLAGPDTPGCTTDARPPRGPLAQLLDHVAHRAPRAAASGAAPASSARAAAREPEALQYFRRTWSRLGADQRLAQSACALPENAGPLHSQHLVHRSLTVMRALSPEYLERFIAHVDGLLWLERANDAAANAPRAGGKDPVRGRSA